VYDFLSGIRPFESLPDKLLIKTARRIKISYYAKGSDQQIIDYDNPRLFVVRSGVFDVRSKNGELLDRVSQGGFFGFQSLLTGDARGNTLSVFEDGLLYRLGQDDFRDLRHESIEFDQFFHQAYERRLRVGQHRRVSNEAMATHLSDVMSPNLVSVSEDASILEAAQIMSEHQIASVVVLNQQNKLAGIFTDKDIRKRVVVKGLDTSEPVKKAMTPNPITIAKDAYVHEAMVQMIRHNIKHLPIVEKERDDTPVAIVTAVDLIRNQRSDPVLLIGQIHKAQSIEELVGICEKIPELLLNLIKVDLRAEDLGRILTTVTGALTRHLIYLAQEKLGPEPVPFVWLAFGSQGRQDQSAKSDQDNGLLISNEMLPEHDAYFKELAQFVCKGLDACGYVYCPGDIMAQTDKWRRPLSGWQAIFNDWITKPKPKSLMHASIFFDMRAIYTSDGGHELFEELQNSVLELAGENSIFLSLMVGNALELTPPLSFLNRLVLDSDGEHKDTLDIKLRGMMPITDIVRIHSLAHGIKAVNNYQRIRDLVKVKAINEKDGLNLLDALEYIAHQRLLHQGEQLKKGIKPDNHLKPSQFSNLTVRHLKDSFQVVRNAQSGLKMAYTHGLS
jgi:CBS domain-containing protein